MFRRRREREMQAEFQFHLEREATERQEPDAQRQAVLALGGEEKWKEAAREQWRGAGFELWLRDLRLAWRGLWRRPGFAVLAILILALGIGANAAMFSVVNAVLLQPLPFQRGNRLINVWSADPRQPGKASWSVLSYPDFLDLRKTPGFTGMAAYTGQAMTLTGGGEPLHVSAEAVSANLFRLLGSTPLVGRTFHANEDQPGRLAGSDAVILSDALARQRFGSAAAAVGQALTLDARPFRVVGVMPAGFQFPLDNREDLWTTIAPLTITNEGTPLTAQRGARWMLAVARLAPGTSLAVANARLDAAGAALRRQYPKEDHDQTFRADAMMAEYTNNARTTLWLLFAAVGLVLLIACINLAGVLLARQARRRQEFALRRALGAGRGALLRQLACESVLLGLLGAAGGVALAWALLGALLPLGPSSVVRLQQAHISPAVLGFSLAAGLIAAFLFGLAPAWELAREKSAGLRTTLASSERGSSASPPRLRRGLMGAQFALAMVVLAGSFLVFTSLSRLSSVALGYQPGNVWSATFAEPGSASTSAASQAAFLQRLRGELRQAPAIASSALAFTPPLQNEEDRMGTDIRDPGQGNRIVGNSMINIVSPGYFRLLQIPLLQGRDFGTGDNHAAPPVAIVNAAYARRFLAGRTALGARTHPDIATFPGPSQTCQIVGIVGDTRQEIHQPDPPIVYLPVQQMPIEPIDVLLRPRPGAEAAALDQLRQAVRALDPSIALYHLRPLTALRQGELASARFATWLLGAFAALALLLVAVGLYGVMSQSVIERRREMAIRLALGAERASVLGIVVREGMRVAAYGLAAGIAGAVLLSQALHSLLAANLFATSALDPLALAGAVALLLAVAWLACALPARRAARSDPASVLRAD